MAATDRRERAGRDAASNDMAASRFLPARAMIIACCVDVEFQGYRERCIM
jgi:hypothetical protein